MGLLYAKHITCTCTSMYVYDFFFIGPDIPVIVGVTVGVVGGISLLSLIVITVAVACGLVRYGKKKGEIILIQFIRMLKISCEDKL